MSMKPAAERGPRTRRLGPIRRMALLSVAGLVGTLVVSPATFGATGTLAPDAHLPLPTFAGSSAPTPASVDPTLDAEIAAKGQTTVIVSLTSPTTPTGGAAAPSLRASDNARSSRSSPPCRRDRRPPGTSWRTSG